MMTRLKSDWLPTWKCLVTLLTFASFVHRAPAELFGVNFLGNAATPVSSSAGIIPMTNWNNIADTTFNSGLIYSSDGSVSATLAISGTGKTSGWNNGSVADEANGALMNGYEDAGSNNGWVTNRISGLTGASYSVFIYTEGDTARPVSGNLLPNYTINGTRYYTATLGGAFTGFVLGTTMVNNTAQYPPPLTYGNYLEFDNVAPVNGAITISADSDSSSFRSPLNGIEIVASTVPQIETQPLSHRLYTGGVAQFFVTPWNGSVQSWRKNGTALNDGGTITGSKTASLILTNLALTDSGNYDVVVTNSFGSVTSAVANLNVVVETRADQALDGWLDTYLVQTNGQTYFINSMTNRTVAFLWGQAYMIWAVEDAYGRTHSPDQEQLINNLINTFLAQNTSSWSWDSWNDDIAWSVIAMIDGYQITGNPAALNAAILNWNMAYNRGWDDTFGGGIWENMDDVPAGGKGGLSNWTYIIGGDMLYHSTGDTSYLTKSEQIYSWARTNCFNPITGRVYEGIGTNGINGDDNAYNSGLLVNAANSLYQITGTAEYYNDAQLAGNHVVNKYSIMTEDHPANGDFGAEQLVRGLALFATQNNLWPIYWPWMTAQCNAAWNERRTDYNITWNDWAAPTTTNSLDAMECEGAVVVQQVTPTSIPGFINCTNEVSGNIIGTPGSWSNSGNAIAKVFDNNLNTFFDGPDATGDWVGLDFGVGVSNVIGQINYWPRIGYASRMLGGYFQGDNNPTFPNPVTLFTINTTPPDSGIVSAEPITNTTPFRCVRYVGPSNGSCNVAELQFFTPNPPPPPIYLTNYWSGNQLMLSWSGGGQLLEATNLTGPWTTNTSATSPFPVIVNQPQSFYRVLQ